MDSREKLRIEYTGKDGVKNVLELTDVDDDRKPEVRAVARFMGQEWQLGPVESPLAIPDILGPLFAQFPDLLKGWLSS